MQELTVIKCVCFVKKKKKKEKKADTHISLFTFKYTTFPYETTML